MVKVFRKYRVVYATFPFKRDQDIVGVNNSKSSPFKLQFVACVVDGWSDLNHGRGDDIGRKAAKFIVNNFPRIFLELKTKDFKLRAKEAAEIIDKKFLSIFPPYVASVGAFLFGFGEKNIVVTVGSVLVLVWNGKSWYRPKEIGSYSLDLRKYPSDVSRFFGRSELKGDSLYSCEPDVLILDAKKPVLIASDGLEEVLDTEDINKIAKNWDFERTRDLVANILEKIKQKKTQRDDITILLKY